MATVGDPQGDARAAGRFTRLVAHPGFAYPMVFAIQLKVTWGMWWYRDLTYGDTAEYFRGGVQWASDLRGDIAWSPLYTAFYGGLYKLTGDAATATVLHRLITVFAVTGLVLMLMRRLLPAAPALAVAVWWAVLPVNFDSLYEVHLFGVLPPLLAALVVSRRPGPRRRGAALAVLVAGAVLVRNEAVLAVVLLGAACWWHERRPVRTGVSGGASKLTAYGVPVMVVAVVVAGFYARSTVKFPELGPHLREKTTLNFCQVYAFNHQQRHPDWRQSPWLECEGLIRAHFGTSEITVVEAVGRSPIAMARFVGWNLRLVPNGLQLALLNESSGRHNPDYAATRLNQPRAAVLSVVLLALLAAGLWAAWLDRRTWVAWWRTRLWPVAVLGAYTVVVVAIMLTQRPRPEYLFPLSLTIMALFGFALAAVVERLDLWRALNVVVPVLSMVVLAVAPGPDRDEPRLLLDVYRRARALEPTIRHSGGLLLNVHGDACPYVAPTASNCRNSLSFAELGQRAELHGSFAAALEQANLRVVYAEGPFVGHPVLAPLIADPPRVGWRRVAGGGGAVPWVILRRG